MKNYEPTMTFGPEIAGAFEESQRFSQTPSRRDREATIDVLEKFARGGPALELAIGTGWIALPLAARGIRVDGIELSPDMVAELRATPGGSEIAVTTGDMCDVGVEDTYSLIFVVANSLFNVLTQEDQARCFLNVVKHLDYDGVFLIEGFTPGYLYRLRDWQYIDAEGVEIDEVRLDVARHDPIKQLLYETHVSLTPAGVKLNPVITRYAWPSELDLMASIAGLRLKDRWGGWKSEPFTADSRHAISVYSR